MSVAHAEPMTAATANNQAPVSPHSVGGAGGRIAGSKNPLERIEADTLRRAASCPS
jgi:hypothetical protein